MSRDRSSFLRHRQSFPRLYRGLTMFVVVLMIASVTPGPAIIQANAPVPDRDGADVPGAPRPSDPAADWQSQTRQGIEDSEYEVTWQAQTSLRGITQAWHAPNRAHNLRTYFADEGIRVIPRDEPEPSWTWGLTLIGYGRGVLAVPPQHATLSPDRNRIEYRRAHLDEWYVNDRNGLEQGFTLAAPPEEAMPPGRQARALIPGLRRTAADGDGGDPAYLVLELSGDLLARLSDDGQAVDFALPSGGLTSLRYAALEVSDAKGEVLPSWIEGFAESGKRGLRIVFDDANAVYPVTVDPLVTSPAWTAEGDQAVAQFGLTVAGAGDVNGDGYADVIVGAPYYDNGELNEGRIYVYHGSPAGLGTSPAWTAESDLTIAFGTAVGTAGDVNGDDYSDVIVGTYWYANGESLEGAVFVYHGSADGLDHDDGGSGCVASADWCAESDQAGAQFGYAVGTAGDLNGDTYADIIVGSRRYTNGESGEGGVFVYHGSATGLDHDDSASGCPASADWCEESDQVSAQFGYAVGTGGDVNGDGYADVIVGSVNYENGESFEGAVFVYHGSATGLDHDDSASGCPASADWCAESDQADAVFGAAVSTAGDVNGDGYADVIVGTPGYDNGEIGEGAAFVYHGSPTGLDQGGSRPAGTPVNADWTAEVDRVNAYFGYAASTAGDVNGDGYADVIIGAPLFSNGTGGAWVYEGSPSGLAPAHAWAWVTEGDQYGARLGWSVSAAGDVNGDDHDDVILGAPYYSRGESQEGAAFVYHGAPRPTGWRLTRQLGFEPGNIVASHWEVQSDGVPLHGSETIGAVTYGAAPQSVLVTTGRAVDGAIGDPGVDWGADGAEDIAIYEIELLIPPWAGTLQFNTQFLTHEDPADTDTAQFRFYRNGWSGWFPLDDPASASINPPVTHGLNVAGGGTIKLVFQVEDRGNVSIDSGLLISRAFFSQLPFPSDIVLGEDGVDGNGDGVVDYFANPAPRDVSLTSGTYSYGRELLSIPGIGLPFRFAILYSSESGRTGSLGRQWSHSYELHAEEHPSGDVLVRHGNGLADYFEPDGDGGYRPKYPSTYSTLAGDLTSGFTFTTRGNLTYQFTEPGDTPEVRLLQSVTDSNGNSFTLAYGTYGGKKRVDTVTDTRGETIGFAHDPAGRLTSVEYDGPSSDPPSMVAFAYDDATDDLIAFIELSGATTTLAYDDLGNLLAVTDAEGTVVAANTYEQYEGLDLRQSGDRVTRRRLAGDDPLAPDAGTSYEYIRETIRQTDRLQREEVRLYDLKGRLARQITTLDVRWDYGYNQQGNVIEEQRKLPSDPWPETTAASVYDDSGNLISRTDFPGLCVDGLEVGEACEADGDCPGSNCGVQVGMTYDAHNNLLARTNHLGHTTSYTYDASHNLLAETDPLGNTQSHTYAATGLTETSTDARGNTTRFEHDTFGNITAITDAAGGRMDFQWDDLGRKTSATDANGNETNYEHDGAGRLVWKQDALLFERSYTYDADGNLLTLTAPNGTSHAYTYTASDLRGTATDPLGHTTTFAYDAEERLVSITDEADHVTAYQWDDGDRMSGVLESICESGAPGCDVSEATAAADYDEAGNLIKLTDPNDNETHFEYDRLGRPIREIDHLDNDVERSFDARGLLSSRTNARGQTTSYEYDDAGRLVVMTGPDGTVSNAYDASGNIVASVGDRLASVGRTFDALDRLTSRTDVFGNTVEYRYDAVGNLIELTYPTDADLDGAPDTVTYTYDALNRLETVTDWSGNQTIYTYDEVGNLTEALLPDDSLVTYSYDAARRLTGISDRHDGSGTLFFAATYTRDAEGRQTAASTTLPLDPILTEISFDFTYNELNQLVSRESDTYTYDADGNMESGVIDGANIDLSYDGFNQAVAINGDSFRYDVEGNRVEARRPGATRRFVHEPSEGKYSRLLEEHDENGNLVARYVYGMGLIARESAAGDHSVYHYDSRGSAVALSDLSGAITDAYAYDPFGLMVRYEDRTPLDPDTPNPFRYAGRDGVIDEGNGLYYMRARYYAPELMRFVQKDPAPAFDLFETQPLNRYAYVEGDPIQLTDPSGENPLVGVAVSLAIEVAIDLIPDGTFDTPLEEYLLAAALGAMGGAKALKLFGKSAQLAKQAFKKYANILGKKLAKKISRELAKTLAKQLGKTILAEYTKKTLIKAVLYIGGVKVLAKKLIKELWNRDFLGVRSFITSKWNEDFLGISSTAGQIAGWTENALEDTGEFLSGAGEKIEEGWDAVGDWSGLW